METAGYKYFEKTPFAFEFYTSLGAGYRVSFLPADGYVSGGHPLRTFLFSIDVELLYPGAYHVYDVVIGITVAEIVMDFFAADERRIIFYICDPSDGKQQARKRKFDYWFALFDTGDYRKIDAVVRNKNITLNLIFLALKSNGLADDLPSLINEAKDRLDE